MAAALNNGSVPNLTLNDGIVIPQLGFGVFKVSDEEAEPAVLSALDLPRAFS